MGRIRMSIYGCSLRSLETFSAIFAITSVLAAIP